MASSRSRGKRKKKGLGAAGFLLVLFLIALAAAGVTGWAIFTPFGPSTETFVDIPTGSSTTRIARQLQSSGVIRTQFAFDVWRWVRRGKLKAGEYRFDHPMPLPEVYERIARGEVYTVAVTVPEGATVFEVANRLEQAGISSREEFLDEQPRLAALVADIDPQAKTLEGYLFPDTYKFPRRTSATQIAGTMVKRFRTIATEIGLKENVHDVVTLASLVERETAIESERPLVASVFENRLAKHMPLMTDPSVIYGLEVRDQWRGTIYRTDLKRDTPYNTYIHAGLPPGPIANPGLPSLRAAMNPPQTNYLYFVAAGANPQGKSLFSTTLEEHTKNVSGYRQAMKKAGQR
ncbi:MAG TPA: endolytic transglycosylase MltG [Terracidiphilus sp.]|nr:endolytic transglycosylase MltG [Terracidiphilus sp.]